MVAAPKPVPATAPIPSAVACAEATAKPVTSLAAANNMAFDPTAMMQQAQFAAGFAAAAAMMQSFQQMGQFQQQMAQQHQQMMTMQKQQTSSVAQAQPNQPNMG